MKLLTEEKKQNINAKFDVINNKLIIDFKENNKDINLFTLEKIYF